MQIELVKIVMKLVQKQCNEGINNEIYGNMNNYR